MARERPAVRIRTLDYKDLQDIAEIDRLVLGKERPEFWMMKVELSEHFSPMASLVAEVDGKVVGFIIGDVSGWEYGVPDTVVWIDTIGVHPEYRRMGIATLLFREMVDSLKKAGVENVYTLVKDSSAELLQFFTRMGFEKGDLVHLKLKIGRKKKAEASQGPGHK